MNQLSFLGQITTPLVEAKDWQLRLKAGDYYAIERPIVRVVTDVGRVERTEGPTVYGQIITGTPVEGEPAYRPGYFLVRAYSRWCPAGELGTFHISEATRQLTGAEFEAARAAGWPDKFSKEGTL